MAMITSDIPNQLNAKLNRDKKRYGLSKSYLVRAILQHHYDTELPLSLKELGKATQGGNA